MPRPTLALLLDHPIGEYQEELHVAVERAALERGVHLLTLIGRALEPPHAKEAALNRIYELIDRRRVAGVVIAGVIGTQCGEEPLFRLAQRLAPIPLCSVGVRIPSVPALAIDDNHAMRSMLDHMFEHGCRRIAFIRGPTTSAEADLRYAAYQECLRDNGLPFRDQLVAVGNFDLSSGVAAMERVLSSGESFDAVVASNDNMALGAAQVLQSRGIRIPHQVLLAGFDDFPLARFANPPLTSVRQPLQRLGQLAVETLLASIEGRSVAELVEVPSELVLRQSCGCAYKVIQRRKSVLPRLPQQNPMDVLRERRQELEGLLREASRLSDELLPGWLDRILDALADELTGSHGRFLLELEDLLSLAVERHQPVDEFHPLIAVLRAEVRGGQVNSREVDELLHAAGILIGVTSTRAEGRERLASEYAAALIRESIARLSTTLSHEALKAGLLDLLPAVKIPRSLVALYADAEQTQLRWFFGSDGAQEMAGAEANYPSYELTPPAFVPDERAVSLVVEPLTFESEQLGLLVLESGATSVVYGILRELISASLKGASLHQSVVQQTALRERAERAQLEGELRIAARIQTAVLPVDVRAPWLSVAAKMVPALEVGGDYYDVHPTPNACWIGIGDVTGHGLRAGLVMLMIQSMVSALVEQRPDSEPAALVNCLNGALYRNVRDRLAFDDHATFSLIRVDPDGLVCWAGAHEDLIVQRARDGSCEVFPAKGVWVGARRDISAATEAQRLRLESGDRIVLYTDGVIEAMDSHHQQFGLDRVISMIEAHAGADSVALCEALVDAAQRFAIVQQDDITVVVLRYAPTSA
ncbi:MAG: substrate-binding domain-containing protein [Polyangiaceae bacterium]